MSQQSWSILALGIGIMILAFVTSVFGFELLSTTTTTATTSSASGLEIYTGNGKEELTIVRGGVADQVLKWQNDGTIGWDTDSTTAVTGAGAVALDLADDGSDESTALAEIATTGDTNSIFTEPSSDKLLIDLGNDWPNADTATALAADPTDCGATLFADAIAANGDLTCSAIIDADVPDTITVNLSATATALASNPTDCAADTKADAIAASGDLTCSAVDTGDITDGTILEADIAAVDSASDEECLTYESTGGDFEWQSCGGGTSIVLDLADDASDESTALSEIATTGDTNSIFGEPSADKLLITLSNNWPSADTADALSSNPTDCSANQFANAIVANGNLTCSAITDADVPDSITITLAATATALAANGANCSAGEAPLGVDASGAAETCTDFEEDLLNSAGLASALNDENGTGNVLFDTDPIMGGTVQVTGSGTTLNLNLDCTANSNGGVLTTDSSGEVICDDDDSTAGGGNSFDTIDVPTGTDPTASGAETLTLTSPQGTVSITGVATDTIQFDLDPSGVDGTNWGPDTAGFTWRFLIGGTLDPIFRFADGLITFVTDLLLDNEAELRWGENDSNGDNYIAVKAPAAITSNQTCELEDDSTPFDSCITAGSAQNLFETFDAPLGTDPVADAADDTLTLQSASGTVSITGSSAADSLDFGITPGSVDISDYTNLTAGRSLTLTGDEVLADAELYTIKKSINIINPTTSETNLVQYEYATASTIIEVSCSTDTGTVTIQFDERARSTPNSAGTNVLSSSLVCDTDSQTTSSFSNAGIAADVPFNLQITATASTPGVVRIHVEATKDD